MPKSTAETPRQPIEKPADSPLVGGRYRLYKTFAIGGMGEVRLGEIVGARGFHRVVAVKCVRPEFAMDQAFTTMLHDEANIVSRIRHANVVPVLDLLEEGEGLYLVMEYIHGEPLSRLVVESSRRGEMVPAHIAIKLVVDMLEGLHAAHDAKSITGEPLNVVHRDISPQNLLVGVDGVGRVLDFGIAKAVGRSRRSREGELKGKMAYMAPEQLRGKNATKETDVYAAAIVLWEMLAGRRYHMGLDQKGIVNRTCNEPPLSITTVRGDLSAALDALITQGLAKDPARRFSSAQAMANALRGVAKLATPNEVGRLVSALAKDILTDRAKMLEDIDRRHTKAPPPMPNGDEDGGVDVAAPALTRADGSGLAFPFPPLPPPLPASQPTVLVAQQVDPGDATSAGEVPAIVAALARGDSPSIPPLPPQRAPAPTMKGLPPPAKASAPVPANDRTSGTAPMAKPVEPPKPFAPASIPAVDSEPAVSRTVPLAASNPEVVRARAAIASSPNIPPSSPAVSSHPGVPSSGAYSSGPVVPLVPSLPAAQPAFPQASAPYAIGPRASSPALAPPSSPDLNPAPPSLVIPTRASAPDGMHDPYAPAIPTGPITLQRQGFIGAPMWNEAPPPPPMAPWGITPPKEPEPKNAALAAGVTTFVAFGLFSLVAVAAIAFCVFFPG